MFSKEGPALLYFGLASVFFALLGAVMIAAGVALVTWWSNDDTYKPIIHPLEDLSEVLTPEETPGQANDKPVVRLVRKGLVETASKTPNLGKPYQNLAGRPLLSSDTSSKRQEGGGVSVSQGRQISGGRASDPANKHGSAPPVAPPMAEATPAPTAPPAPAKGAASEGPVSAATAALPTPGRKPTATPTSLASTPTALMAPPESPTPQARSAIMPVTLPPRGADNHNRGRGSDDHRGGARGR